MSKFTPKPICEICAHGVFKVGNDLGKCIIGGVTMSVPTRRNCFCTAHKIREK